MAGKYAAISVQSLVKYEKKKINILICYYNINFFKFQQAILLIICVGGGGDGGCSFNH